VRGVVRVLLALVASLLMAIVVAPVSFGSNAANAYGAATLTRVDGYSAAPYTYDVPT
jgi:hypothetical protein